MNFPLFVAHPFFTDSRTSHFRDLQQLLMDLEARLATAAGAM